MAPIPYDNMCVWDLFRKFYDKTVELLFCPNLNSVLGLGMNFHASYSPLPLGTTLFLSVSLPRLFPPESQLECLSDKARHEHVCHVWWCYSQHRC